MADFSIAQEINGRQKLDAETKDRRRPKLKRKEKKRDTLKENNTGRRNNITAAILVTAAQIKTAKIKQQKLRDGWILVPGRHMGGIYFYVGPKLIAMQRFYYGASLFLCFYIRCKIMGRQKF